MMGLIVIFVAGEEISWGQRIFHFQTPPFFYQFNYQGEFNFHNSQSVASWNLYVVAAYLVIFWSLFSLVVSIWRPPFKEGIGKLGLPIIPVPLLMLFLCASCFILLSPITKSDEIGELFLGLASAMLAMDLFLGHGGARRLRGFGAAIAAIAMVSSIGIISLILTRFFPLDMGWSLNRFAVQEYPSLGMYTQADQIYHYIYAQPRYLNSETRINHGKMLLRIGKKEEAFFILSQALKEFGALGPEKFQQSKYLRRVGTIHALLGDALQANAMFDRAVKVDEQRLEGASAADEKAGILWSLAKTLDAWGDRSAAMDRAREARAAAISPRIRRQIGNWMKRR
jgi:tetratricopeptide (TPR) repeat protein